ncbi:hypothetical protein BGZ70_002625 [Mortierella alpina]|uniref:Uncharacterized protein n=1 Tax=Mortierella alpina TaxID=64518 RepID=A0A9P6JB59_MORAP|nr:hypothetical protein BGZ70_002625 [Mortierella alpina]
MHDMARFIKWFRLLILCLALISFILGMTLNANFEFPDKLAFLLISEALTVTFYAKFTYGSKQARKNRTLRIFFRLALAFLTVFWPLKAFRECEYEVRRNYERDEPGIHLYEQIYCRGTDRRRRVPLDEGEPSILPLYRLFRVRCIITLTVCVLITLEMFQYGWSDEHKGFSQDQTAPATETRDDVELAGTAAKMARYVKWLRILIICLALVSFIIGMSLREQLSELDSLTLVLVMEALTVVLYSIFLYKFKVQFRVWRIFLRLLTSILLLAGSIKTVVNDCQYSVERDYGAESPGFHLTELIHCNDGYRRTWGNHRRPWGHQEVELISVYRLFRARCILSFTVCALMLLELLRYWRSTEGSPRESALTAEVQADVELGKISFEEPQKMVLPDAPPHPSTAA